jgi:glycosyltransferase involved in cell wall biosynthesis
LKILIVTAWYAPFIHPRAHRWTALAEHWAAEGHDVQVLTARQRGHANDSILNGVRVHRVGFDSLKEVAYHWLGSRHARGRVGAAPVRPGLRARVGAWLYRSVWKNLYFPDDACVWYFPARRRLFQLIENQNFDALITVSLPFTDHLLGLAAKRKKPALFWLADIGDPFAFQAKPPNNSLFFRQKNLRLERLILESADAASVTTDALRAKYRDLFGPSAVARVRAIPPLLHPILAISPSPIEASASPTIKIGYFGALYAPTRTPDAFLALLAQTRARRPDLAARLEVHFYGEVFPEFLKKLAQQPEIRLHGLRPRAEVQAAMRAVDVLLNIGNQTDFQLPSKAVEYLAAGRPILNICAVERDPFARFFGDNPLIFNLKVESGVAQASDLDGFWTWLESEKPRLGEADIRARIAPYTVAAIGAQYLALLRQNLPHEV